MIRLAPSSLIWPRLLFFISRGHGTNKDGLDENTFSNATRQIKLG